MLRLLSCLPIAYVVAMRRMENDSNKVQIIVGASSSSSVTSNAESVHLKSESSNRSSLIQCNPICAKCNDGTRFVIMRDLDDRQFRRMLAVQGITLAAQLTLRALLPGVPDAAHVAAQAVLHTPIADLIFSWVATKLQNKSLELTLDFLDTAMAGENKCNEVGVLANKKISALSPFGAEASLPGSQDYHYISIDPPGTGQREFTDEQVTQLDIWRKSMDAIMDSERSSKGLGFIRRNLRATHEWAGIDGYGWIEVPDSITQLLDESPLFCEPREGVDDVMIMGNLKTWGVKNPTLRKIGGHKTEYDAVLEKCERLYADDSSVYEAMYKKLSGDDPDSDSDTGEDSPESDEKGGKTIRVHI